MNDMYLCTQQANWPISRREKGGERRAQPAHTRETSKKLKQEELIGRIRKRSHSQNFLLLSLSCVGTILPEDREMPTAAHVKSKHKGCGLEVIQAKSGRAPFKFVNFSILNKHLLKKASYRRNSINGSENINCSIRRSKLCSS